MRKKIKKYLLILIGLLTITLAIIGVILPILPTTPFLILAMACFANSSPRFHSMLLNNRWFGATLQQWEQDRTITRTSKLKAIILVILTFSLYHHTSRKITVTNWLIRYRQHFACFYVVPERSQNNNSSHQH